MLYSGRWPCIDDNVNSTFLSGEMLNKVTLGVALGTQWGKSTELLSLESLVEKLVIQMSE